MTLSSQELFKLSSATARLYEPCGLKELPEKMIAVARDVLSCEHLSYNEFGENHFVGVLDPIIPPELNATFARLADQHPSIAHLQDTKTDQAVKISDFASQRNWRKTELFNEFFRQINIHHQLAFLFKVGETQVGFAANREKTDFSEKERLVLSYLLPHLRQAYVNAGAYDRARRAMDQQGYGTLVFNRSGKILLCSPRAESTIQRFFGKIQDEKLPEELKRWVTRGLRSNTVDAYSAGSLQPLQKALAGSQLTIRLSPDHQTQEHVLTVDEQPTDLPVTVFKKYGHSTREAEVLSWIAQGKTNPEIAIILDISAKTVAHHVERILSRIGVEGRGSAGAWAQETLRSERMNYQTVDHIIEG